jgi:Zn-dependent peptidase ImmA (M78 family)
MTNNQLYFLRKKASEFRSNNGLSKTEPIQLKSLLLRLNVLTVYKQLFHKFSGMALKLENDRFILINSSQSIGRQHFTICHELYHLYVQKDFESMTCFTETFDTTDKEEFNADIFASNLLIPEEGLFELIDAEEVHKDKIRIETILKIEHYYSCSRAALLYRLKQLKLISDIKFSQYNKNISRTALEYGFSTQLYKPGNKNNIVGDYGKIAKELFNNNKISESHYVELMNTIDIDVLKS